MMISSTLLYFTIILIYILSINSFLVTKFKYTINRNQYDRVIDRVRQDRHHEVQHYEGFTKQFTILSIDNNNRGYRLGSKVNDGEEERGAKGEDEVRRRRQQVKAARVARLGSATVCDTSTL